MKLTAKHVLLSTGSLLVLALVTAVLRDAPSERGTGRTHAPIVTRPATTAGRVALAPPEAPVPSTVRPAEEPRPRVAPSSVPTAAPAPSSRVDAVATASAPAPDVTKLRQGLRSPSPKERLESLRATRDLRSPELEADVALLLRSERVPAIRRVASQMLARGDVRQHETLLRTLKTDRDPIVQLNATFGLARTGDEVEQACLLLFCEAARARSPELLPIVAQALEDPALRSPAIVARFQQLASDPKLPADVRDRATKVLQAKGQRT